MLDITKESDEIAICHDYLVQMGGAEYVVASMARMYPGAPIYTSVVDRQRLLRELAGSDIRESWMKRLPGIAEHFKKYFLLYPAAFGTLRPRKGRVALVSSSGFSKWLDVSKFETSICYCHTPPRFFWSPDSYLHREIENRFVRWTAKSVLRFLKRLDYRQAQKFDHFIANSKFVQERIQRCYGRSSTVIYPPVRVSEFEVSHESEDFYLIVSRIVAYKRIDLAVQAFAKNGRKLIVVGEGADLKRLRGIAAPNVSILGWQPREEVVRLMQKTRGLIFPGLEDFGITPVEANACGKPVLAFGAGGALETVVSGVSGLHFEDQSVASLNQALERFETMDWDPGLIRKNAERFDERRFMLELAEFVEIACKSVAGSD